MGNPTSVFPSAAREAIRVNMSDEEASRVSINDLMCEALGRGGHKAAFVVAVGIMKTEPGDSGCV